MLAKLLLRNVLCSLSDKSLSEMSNNTENADQVIGL